MKVFAIVVLLAATVCAEELESAESYVGPVNYDNIPATYAHAPVTYAHAPVLATHAAYGAAHGASGYLNQASGVAGYGALGAHSRYGQAAYGAAGVTANAAHRDVNARAAVGASGASYNDQGAYARNKGSGFEKAYNFDKKAGYRDVGATHGAYGSAHGLSDVSASRNLNAYGRYGQSAYGASDLTAGHGYAAHGQLTTGHANAGGTYGTSYLNIPGYTGHYVY